MIWVVNLFHIVFKGNHKEHFVKTLKVLLRDLKGIVPSPFKVTTRNYSYTIKTGRSKVCATRSTIADDLKPLSEISKSQTRSLCSANSR